VGARAFALALRKSRVHYLCAFDLSLNHGAIYRIIALVHDILHLFAENATVVRLTFLY
jgi:hypothetical protein